MSKLADLLLEFRVLYRSPVHDHIWRYLPLMDVRQCLVCPAMEDLEANL